MLIVVAPAWNRSYDRIRPRPPVWAALVVYSMQASGLG